MSNTMSKPKRTEIIRMYQASKRNGDSNKEITFDMKIRNAE